MVDVATVSSVTPPPQQAAAATPTSIDAMFSALLQQITDGAAANDAQSGANVSAAQVQTLFSVQTGMAPPQPSNANGIALIQNFAARALDATNAVTAANSAVAVMPTDTVVSDGATAAPSDIAALLARFSAQKSSAIADKAGKDASGIDPGMPPTVQSTAPTSSSTASASSSAAAAASKSPATQANDKTDATNKDSAPTDQATSNAQPAVFSAFAALFAPQWTSSQQPSMQQSAVPQSTQANAQQQQPNAQQQQQPGTDASVANSTSTPALMPVAAPIKSDQSVDSRSLSAVSQSTTRLAYTQQTAEAAPVSQPVNDTQSIQPEAGTDQSGSIITANDAAKVANTTSNPPADASTEAASKGAAESQPAQTADQTAIAAPLSASIQQAVTQAPTAVASTPVTGVPTANDRIAAATTSQIAGQTTQAFGANNKTDQKNKVAAATKTQDSSGKSTESGPATEVGSQTSNETRAAVQPIATNDTKPVQPDPAHVVTVPANHEKATADTSALQQPASPLATVDPGTVTAKVQITTQHSDSDIVSTLDKLGMTIAARSAEGLHHFDIRLDPADLGRVQVRLTVDDSGQAQATVVADKQQTLDMLQRDSSSLNRALQDAGLNMSNNGLNFSLREQYQKNEASAQGRRRSLSAETVLSTDASQSRSSQGSYAPNSVRLDIRV